MIRCFRKLQKIPGKVYVMISDGECQEGTTWESLLIGSKHKLDNLVVLIDYNKIQSLDSVANTLALEPFKDKWESFGWQVVGVDGHNIEELYDAFTAEYEKNKPVAIIAHTIKGKGFSFSENNNDWHHATLTKSQYEIAINELN